MNPLSKKLPRSRVMQTTIIVLTQNHESVPRDSPRLPPHLSVSQLLLSNLLHSIPSNYIPSSASINHIQLYFTRIFQLFVVIHSQ